MTGRKLNRRYRFSRPLRLRSVLPLAALAVLSSSCSTTTIISTFPRAYEVTIDGERYGQAPAKLSLSNRGLPDYVIVLRDEKRKEVFRDKMPLDLALWRSFWPPLGYFYNRYAVMPEYEIDVTVYTPPAGTPPTRFSDERGHSLVRSSDPSVNAWTDLGFGFLDRGWLLQARKSFELSLDKDPSYPDAMLGLAIYYRQKGDSETAQQWLHRYSTARG